MVEYIEKEAAQKIIYCNSYFKLSDFYRAYTMTRADRIRSMTDEELAEFILPITECGRCPTGAIPCTGDSCRGTLLDWLREEAAT